MIIITDETIKISLVSSTFSPDFLFTLLELIASSVSFRLFFSPLYFSETCFLFLLPFKGTPQLKQFMFLIEFSSPQFLQIITSLTPSASALGSVIEFIFEPQLGQNLNSPSSLYPH